MTEASRPQWAIEIEGVTKAFGPQPVLRGINLQVRRGEFLTLFGPNGAGKTTLIKILATLIKPSSGRVTLEGLNLAEQAAEIRRLIGFMGHQTLIYEELSAGENLKFYGRMYHVPGLEERIQSVAERVGLHSRLHDRVHTLSHGMQKRFSIARAIIHDPAILLLDEPEAGLDEHASALLVDILQGLTREGRTVLMTTHNLERGLHWGSQVAILAQGRIVYTGAQPEDVGSFSQMYQRLAGVAG